MGPRTVLGGCRISYLLQDLIARPSSLLQVTIPTMLFWPAFGIVLSVNSSSLGAELPLMVESYGLLNDIFPFPSILDAGYPIFNLHLANVLFDVILPSVLGSCDLLVRGFHLNIFLTVLVSGILCR